MDYLLAYWQSKLCFRASPWVLPPLPPPPTLHQPKPRFHPHSPYSWTEVSHSAWTRIVDATILDLQFSPFLQVRAMPLFQPVTVHIAVHTMQGQTVSSSNMYGSLCTGDLGASGEESGLRRGRQTKCVCWSSCDPQELRDLFLCLRCLGKWLCYIYASYVLKQSNIKCTGIFREWALFWERGGACHLAKYPQSSGTKQHFVANEVATTALYCWMSCGLPGHKTLCSCYKTFATWCWFVEICSSGNAIWTFEKPGNSFLRVQIFGTWKFLLVLVHWNRHFTFKWLMHKSNIIYSTFVLYCKWNSLNRSCFWEGTASFLIPCISNRNGEVSGAKYIKNTD